MEPSTDAPPLSDRALSDGLLGAPEGPSLVGPPLQSSAKLLQDVLDSLTDGVVVADLQGRFVQFNPAAERILGLGPLGVPSSEWSPSYGCFREDMVTPFPSEELPLSRGRDQNSRNSKSCTRRTFSAVMDPRPNTAAPTAAPLPSVTSAFAATAARIWMW